MGWLEALEPAALAVIRLMVLESLYVVPIFAVLGVASRFLRTRGTRGHASISSVSACAMRKSSVAATSNRDPMRVPWSMWPPSV